MKELFTCVLKATRNSMRAVFFTLDRWAPVILRAVLWMTIAMATSFLDKTENFTSEKLAAMHFFDWLRVGLFTFLAGAISLRTFIDTTVSTHVAKLAKDGNGDETKFFQKLNVPAEEKHDEVKPS